MNAKIEPKGVGVSRVAIIMIIISLAILSTVFFKFYIDESKVSQNLRNKLSVCNTQNSISGNNFKDRMCLEWQERVSVAENTLRANMNYNKCVKKKHPKFGWIYECPRSKNPIFFVTHVNTESR